MAHPSSGKPIFVPNVSGMHEWTGDSQRIISKMIIKRKRKRKRKTGEMVMLDERRGVEVVAIDDAISGSRFRYEEGMRSRNFERGLQSIGVLASILISQAITYGTRMVHIALMAIHIQGRLGRIKRHAIPFHIDLHFRRDFFRSPKPGLELTISPYLPLSFVVS